jgi:hypothetical protein
MKNLKVLFVIVLVNFIFTALIFAQQGSMDWTQATANAGWLGRSGHTSVVFDNKMWVMGGYPYRNDVWYSTNGVNWTQATANAGWSARSLPTSVVFDNKMWVMGGVDGSGYSKRDVWYSSDGVNWTQATANAQWLARHGHTSVVFDNKMWVIGGNAAGYRNDVWYSTDGVNWIQATANAGWLARYSHTSVVFDNKMWVMGGVDMRNYRNDVWFSTDGVNWTQATANAQWSARYLHTSVVFDNKMLVLGGEVSGGKRNDVWFSTNGVNWIQATANAGWSSRYGHTSVVFDNKMWVMSGDDGSYKRDVWYSRGGITLLIPNGGENWAGGSNQIIKWRTIGTGFARYRLLLSRNSGSTYTDTIAHNVAPTETTYNWVVPLLDLTTCRVGVQVLNSIDSVIAQDASDGNFTIRTVIIVSPNGGEIWAGGSNQIIKWWTIGTGFVRHRLLLSSNSGLTYPDTIAHNIAPTETTYNWLVPTLNLNTCRIMVQMLDAGGSVISQDASDGNFTIDSDSPSIPNIVSPANSTITNNPNVIFIWNRSTDNLSGILRYTLEYARNSGFTNPIDTVVTDSFITLTLTDTTYYWRVKSQDSAGNQSNWSSSRSFEVDTRIPNAPTLVSPINGVWFTNTAVIFNWSSVTFDAKSEVRYILQVDTLTTFTTPRIDTTSLVSDTLILPQDRYYWRVKAYDLAGNEGAFSGRDSFGIDYTAPSIPNLVSPANSAVLTDSFVRFTWNRSTDNVSGVRNYRFQVANDTNFTNPTDTVVSDTSITLLLRGTKYWHVKAIDRAGNASNWSQRRLFTVTGIEEIKNGTIPTLFNLYQNSPNPFNSLTGIRYSIPRECNVSVSIYDISGKLVKNLVDETMNAGVYSISWNGNDNDGRNVGQGVYFYILKTTGEKMQKKMLMLR